MKRKTSHGACLTVSLGPGFAHLSQRGAAHSEMALRGKAVPPSLMSSVPSLCPHSRRREHTPKSYSLTFTCGHMCPPPHKLKKKCNFVFKRGHPGDSSLPTQALAWNPSSRWREPTLSSACALWPLYMCVHAHRHTFFKDAA